MRPQHITAENPARRRRRDPLGDASMRPQHITAENSSSVQAEERHWRSASMRPQHITAENPRRSVASEVFQ